MKPSNLQLMRFAVDFFRQRYRIESWRELVPTETPGYWRFVKECKGECNEGHTTPMYHTATFTEPGVRDDNGKFVSPYRAWHAWKTCLKERQEPIAEFDENVRLEECLPYPPSRSTPMNRVSGILCRSIDGTYFFRTQDANGEFTDHELRHTELSITILDGDAFSYRVGDKHILDHSLRTLGLREYDPSPINPKEKNDVLQS